MKIMSEKMLKFVKVNQQTPKKETIKRELMTLMKFMINLLVKKLRSNPVGVHNVEFHFAKFIVLYITIFPTG